MRKLTITRKKAFSGGALTMLVYIEDENAHDLVLNNKNCRYLGTLKNGRTETFDIGDEEARIYVTAGGKIKEINCDLLKIPAGTEDVFLSGKNIFSLLNSVFRFDGEVDEEIAAFRKRVSRKGRKKAVINLSIGLLAAVAAFFITYNLMKKNPTSKEYTVSEFSITLTDDLNYSEEKNDKGFTVYCFSNRDYTVAVLPEFFFVYSGLEQTSEKDYIDLLAFNNGKSDKDIISKDGIMYYTYSAKRGEKNYMYRISAIKGEKGFWEVAIIAEESYFMKHEDMFMKFLSSMKIKEQNTDNLYLS